MKLNQHYRELNESYLFSTIAKKVAEFTQAHPDREVIRLGIGDVTLPLCGAVTDAMQKAVLEMGRKETFHGYGPEQGYDFLKQAIAGYYRERDIVLELREIFISDGAKSDVGNILDLFSADNTVLIPDPVYPVYVDTNLMAGRPVIYMNATAENGFLPLPDPAVKADIIYLCSPNNPTGAVYSHEQLKVWVDYAREQNAVILFDAAYEAFIRDDSLPRSIFEIEGAKQCAIEFCSFSKTAGFTGTRCGYTIVPGELAFDGVNLNAMWLRRQSTKFNGVPYIVQKGAEAVFTPLGREQIQESIDYYRKNAAVLADTLREKNIWFTGGDHSPYLWMRCPGGRSSWEFFDFLLSEAGIVGTPGSGFGKNGEGFFRLTAFGGQENTKKAAQLLKSVL